MQTGERTAVGDNRAAKFEQFWHLPASQKPQFPRIDVFVHLTQASFLVLSAKHSMLIA